MPHHVGPSNANNTSLNLYGQQQNLSTSSESQSFYQQSISSTNGQPSNEVHYLGNPNAAMSGNLQTKKDAPYTNHKRKSRISAMYNDVPHHPKRSKGIQIEKDSHAARECCSNDSLNNKGKSVSVEGVSVHAQPIEPYATLVFRTARDRISEGNIDDFKIRLYNVAGNRRYDLPSSHTLGAIVFEPEGNSQTDYDIIVEYKDGQPQRINKLHSSYMMAESSKLTIQSAPGNKIMQVKANIRDLRPKDRNKIIEAVVYRAWIARDPPDTTEKGCKAILLDKQGDAIQGSMDIRDKSFFTKVFIPGRAYRISNFACYPTENWQQTLENPTSLSFTRFSNFDAIPPEGFPAHYFNFVSYNRLPSKVVDPNDKGRKDYPVLTDYIGCYISSGNAETIGNPNKDQMVNRKIEIQNLNRVSIELTLWDELAEKFEKNEIDNLERPVIIAVSSCRVQRYNFKGYLTDGSATVMITFFTPKADDIVGSQTPQEEYSASVVDVPQNQQLTVAFQSAPALAPPLNETSSQLNITREQPAEDLTPTESMAAVTPLPNEISTDINPTQEQPAKEEAPTEKAYTGMQTRSRTDAIQGTNIQPSKTIEQANTESLEHDDMAYQNEPVNTPIQPEDYSTHAISKSSASTGNRPTTSKRALFQGKTGDAKKNKKE
ncbi:nucleic acid-binding, OB-fold protein [Artemisia annua]|uniref:Nucleic acid-binding, OB-fold protein n=1 Tax=Artemisia annua TaxID=35608 RepID=A0A2U1LAP3_ARTAN|nr:nucleic acid-binding, OB-fold protein [Artemisia annua]